MRSRPEAEAGGGSSRGTASVLGVLATLVLGAPAEAGWRGAVTFAGEAKPVRLTITPRQALPAAGGRCRALPNSGDVDVALRAADCQDVASNLELLKRARAFTPARPLLELETDDHGAFEAGRLGPGAYDVVVRDGRRAWYVPVEAGAEPVAIELPASERFASEASSSVSQVLSRFPRDEKPWVVGLDVPIVLPPSESRRAPLPVLPEGTYVVLEETGRRRRVVATGVVSPLGRRPEDFFALEGKVTENGAPAAGVEVVLAETKRVPERVRTDRAGRFMVLASRGGHSSIAAAQGEACALVNDAPKPSLGGPEEKPPPLVLELEPCRAQVLKVADEKGRSLPAQATAFFATGNDSVFAGTFSDGRMLLPPGEFDSVFLQAPGAVKRRLSSPLPRTLVLPALVRHTLRLRTATGAAPALEGCRDSEVEARFAELPGAWELATGPSATSVTCAVRGFPVLTIPLTPPLTTFELPSLTAVHLPERLGDHRARSTFDDLRTVRVGSVVSGPRVRVRPGPLAVTTCATEPPASCAFIVADVPATGLLDLAVEAPALVEWSIELRDEAGQPLAAGTRVEAVGGGAGEQVVIKTTGAGPAPVRTTAGWFQVSRGSGAVFRESGEIFGWCLAGKPCRLQRAKPTPATQLTLTVEGAPSGTAVSLDGDRGGKLVGDQLLRAVEAGEHLLVVDGSLVAAFKAAPGQPAKVKLAAGAPTAADVEVTDESGGPVANARVWWGYRESARQPFRESSAASEARTDAAGRARFDRVRLGPPSPPGVPGVLRVVADGYAPVAVDPEPGTTRVVLRKARSVELASSVLPPEARLGAQVVTSDPSSMELVPWLSGEPGKPLTVPLPPWSTPTRLVWSVSLPRRGFGLPEADASALGERVVATVPKEGALLVFPTLGDESAVTVLVGVRLAPDELVTKGREVLQASCNADSDQPVCALGPIPRGPATAVLRRQTVKGQRGPRLVWSFDVGEAPVQVIRPGPDAKALEAR